MFLVDIVQVAGGTIGLFISIIYFLGYSRNGNINALVLGVIALSLALISVLPLLYFLFGSMKGELPSWGWISPVPILTFTLITLIRTFFRGIRKEGEGD